jgi:outer membrane protein assembly factor BamB
LNSDGNLLISNYSSSDGKPVLELLNKETGERIWQWKGFYNDENSPTSNKTAQFDDHLVFNPGYNNYSVNIKTGQTNWRYNSNLYYQSKLSKDQDGNVYQVFTDHLGYANFYRLDHKTGKRVALFNYQDSMEGHNLHITSTEIAYNQAGDKLLVFSMALFYNNDMGEYSVINRMIAYNLNKNRYEWKREFSHKFWMFSRLFYNGSEIYSFANADYNTGYNNYLVCIDANDGSEKWVQELPSNGVDLHLVNDNIIAMRATSDDNSEAIYCFNQKTGNMVWTKRFSNTDRPRPSFGFYESVIFKNYLFITQSDGLLVIDINTGGIVFYKDIRINFRSSFSQPIAIDAARRVFYVHDNDLIVCYKLPEEIVY